MGWWCWGPFFLESHRAVAFLLGEKRLYIRAMRFQVGAVLRIAPCKWFPIRRNHLLDREQRVKHSRTDRFNFGKAICRCGFAKLLNFPYRRKILKFHTNFAWRSIRVREAIFYITSVWGCVGGGILNFLCCRKIAQTALGGF